jgi:hypothetical protein
MSDKTSPLKPLKDANEEQYIRQREAEKFKAKQEKAKAEAEKTKASHLK